MIKHFLDPGIIYVLGTLEDTSKTNHCNRVGKHLFRANIDAVDMKERASGLGPAGWVEVDLVKKKGKILQKETAQNCALGGGLGVRKAKPAWSFWNQGAWDNREGLKLERQEESRHDKLWLGTPSDLEFIPRVEGSPTRRPSGEETN